MKSMDIAVPGSTELVLSPLSGGFRVSHPDRSSQTDPSAPFTRGGPRFPPLPAAVDSSVYWSALLHELPAAQAERIRGVTQAAAHAGNEADAGCWARPMRIHLKNANGP